MVLMGESSSLSLTGSVVTTVVTTEPFFGIMQKFVRAVVNSRLFHF